MRAAGRGAWARRALAAEVLYPDRRADLVAVDVDVADPGARGDVLDGLVDARVDAQGQAVAGGVDGLDYLVQFAGLPADHVQRRAEVLAVPLRPRLELPGAWREERAMGGVPAPRERERPRVNTRHT